jgi:dienelactone hydrolase
VHAEAGKFAAQGYTAFIADMFGDGKTADNPKDAGALSGGVMKDPQAMQSRFNAARETLAKHQTVDPSRIGAVGYCFGGAVVLNMARAGADLVGVATFHGSLGANVPAPAPGTVKAKVLVLNGADDPFVKPEAIDTFKKEMDAAKVATSSSTTAGRCTPSRIRRRRRRARSSTSRSPTTRRSTRNRRPKRPSSSRTCSRSRTLARSKSRARELNPPGT